MSASSIVELLLVGLGTLVDCFSPPAALLALPCQRTPTLSGLQAVVADVQQSLMLALVVRDDAVVDLSSDTSEVSVTNTVAFHSAPHQARDPTAPRQQSVLPQQAPQTAAAPPHQQPPLQQQPSLQQQPQQQPVAQSKSGFTPQGLRLPGRPVVYSQPGPASGTRCGAAFDISSRVSSLVRSEAGLLVLEEQCCGVSRPLVHDCGYRDCGRWVHGQFKDTPARRC